MLTEIENDVDLDSDAHLIPEPCRRRVLGVVLLILATVLVFAHGCHGDEDNELFSMAAPVLQR